MSSRRVSDMASVERKPLEWDAVRALLFTPYASGPYRDSVFHKPTLRDRISGTMDNVLAMSGTSSDQPNGFIQALDTFNDATNSARTGLRSAAEGVAGMGGDIPSLFARGGRWIDRKLGASPEVQAQNDAIVNAIEKYNPLPTGEAVNRFTSRFVGESYQPQTTAGEFVRTAGELAPALMSPGSAARKLAVWAGATIGAEGGDRGSRALGYDDFAPYARLAGTLIGGGLPAISGRGSRVMSRAGQELDQTRNQLKTLQIVTPRYTISRLRQERLRPTIRQVRSQMKQEDCSETSTETFCQPMCPLQDEEAWVAYLKRLDPKNMSPSQRKERAAHLRWLRRGLLAGTLVELR